MKGSDSMAVKISSDLQELIPSMLRNRRDEILRLRGYLFQKRYREAKDISHALKGVLGSYGFHEACEIAARLDEDLRRKNYRGAGEGAESLSRYMSDIEIEYTEEEF